MTRRQQIVSTVAVKEVDVTRPMAVMASSITGWAGSSTTTTSAPMVSSIVPDYPTRVLNKLNYDECLCGELMATVICIGFVGVCGNVFVCMCIVCREKRGASQEIEQVPFSPIVRNEV